LPSFADLRGQVISLVTGGAGFLGSHLVDALLARGDNVVMLDTLSSGGSLSNIEGALRSGRATFVYVDVSRPLVDIRQSLVEAARFKRITQIFHCAASARQAPLDAHSVIELAIEHGARLIFASTCKVVRHSNAPADVPWDKFDSVDSWASSDAIPWSDEDAVFAAVARGVLDARIVRLFDCYGPRMPKTVGCMVGAFADAASAKRPYPIHGDGRQKRSMTFVTDAIRLLLIVACERQAQLVPICIGSDEEHTVLDIAGAFARVAGTPFIVEHLAPFPFVSQSGSPDLNLPRSLRAVPPTSLSEGLAKTLAWLREGAAAYV
jgi:nucleoside-diphosphate-sugar epimerase